jgi:alanyl aminopeptidase
MVPAVLETAGRFADEATYARLEAAVIAEADRRGRSQLLGGLVMARDPALRDRAWSLALRADGGAPLLDGREAYLVASRAMQDDDNRAAAFTFVRGQWDALVAKFPKDWPIRVTRPLGALCTPEERAAYVDFFGERAAAFLGGPKQYAEALETIDICIAVRQAARKP